jgi:hypothetical protein
MALLVLLVVLLLGMAPGAQAEGLVAQPVAIAAVAPSGAAGVALSLRVAKLSEANNLRLDLGVISETGTAWHGFAGLSSEISAVKNLTSLPICGGVGYDLGTKTIELYLTGEFGTAF